MNFTRLSALAVFVLTLVGISQPASAMQDPVGYVDGMGLYEYTNSQPLIYVDPSGAISVSVNSTGERLHNRRCGDQAEIQWSFSLDRPAPCNGYIVQQVEVRCTVDTCDDKGEGCHTSPVVPDTVYWEAWEIERGKRIARDQAGHRAEENTCGNVSQVGTIAFFCKEPGHRAAGGVGTGDLESQGWEKNQFYGEGSCRIDAGPILATSVPPPWWNQQPIAGVAHRSFSVWWDCCPDCPDFVSADASPRRFPRR